ncbi:SurA N-terminal domain-containing protein [Streptomyces sp. NPDC057638]|uniref:SurA N-terminal domain-containing protein n=1 Tax=Streptomyces sp. NPDC057638 TaxID=3346190 RepID=UPI0036A7A433
MHRRRRTAVVVTSALLLSVPLLAACGNEARPGAAAVVGGERIEVGAVQSKVKAVRVAQERSPQAEQLVKDSGQLTRAKLYDLIVARVVEKAAEDAGVSVTRKEVQTGRAQLVGQAGGEEQLAAMYLQQRGIAPGQLEDVVRRDVLVGKLAEAIGATNGQEGQQKLNAAFSAAAATLDIDVNPRFGTWSDQDLALGEYKAPWITQVTQSQGAPVSGA